MTEITESAEKVRRAAAFTQQGVELFFRGRYAEALALMDEALALDPASVRAYCGRAMCLAQLGKPDEGALMADRALALDPDSGVAFSVRALCRHRRGDDAGAETDYRKAIELEPGDYRGYYNFACYWAEHGDEEKCRSYLAHAFQLATVAFADIAAEDPDLARYSGREWFRELVAETKRRARDGL